jgi:TolB-like protein
MQAASATLPFRPSLRAFLALTCGVLLGIAPSRAEAEKPSEPALTIAILDFKDDSTAPAGTGASASSLLQARLANDSDSPQVERAELHQILKEQELTLTQAMTPGQAVRLGQITGADVIISGNVFATQDRVHIVAKMISSTTGRVLGTSTTYEKDGDLDRAVTALSSQVAKSLKDRRQELVGTKPLREIQLEQIQRLMKGRTPPRFFITIEEPPKSPLQASPPVAAALADLLQAAGWKPALSKDQADLIIRGKATTETATRRGHLWFIRARLDLSIEDPASNQLGEAKLAATYLDNEQPAAAAGALHKTGLLGAIHVVKISTEKSAR